MLFTNTANIANLLIKVIPNYRNSVFKVHTANYRQKTSVGNCLAYPLTNDCILFF